MKIQTAMPLLTKQEFGKIPGKCLLMHILSVDKVNELYDRNIMYKGPAFARAVLRDLDIHYEIENLQVLDSLPEGPFVTISNHPIGHMDGMIMMDLFGHLRRDYKIMANRILAGIEPLKDNFISVTPAGNERTAPTKESVSGIKNAMCHVRSGHPLGIFPAGAVSDLVLKDGLAVQDREWQEPVIRLIKKLNVPIVPVTFLDGNSAFYYTLGLIDWRVRLLRLPSEVFNKSGKTIRLMLGNIITPQEQDGFEDVNEFRSFLRNKVYGLKQDYYDR